MDWAGASRGSSDGLESHADQLTLAARIRVAALDNHTHQFELGDDAGWEFDPGFLQLRIAHRGTGGPTQRIQQYRLLLIERDDTITRRSRPQRSTSLMRRCRSGTAFVFPVAARANQ